MTIAELLGQSAETLAKMTDEELLGYFKPMLALCNVDVMQKRHLVDADAEDEESAYSKVGEKLPEQEYIELGDNAGIGAGVRVAKKPRKTVVKDSAEARKLKMEQAKIKAEAQLREMLKVTCAKEGTNFEEAWSRYQAAAKIM